MSKTHGKLTIRDLNLIHFGGTRQLAMRMASDGNRTLARRFGRQARELWKDITQQPTGREF